MKLFRSAFVVTLAISLIGGLLFVLAQAVAVVAGQGQWLLDLTNTVKIPVIVASSLCAIFGFLLTYGKADEGGSTRITDAH